MFFTGLVLTEFEIWQAINYLTLKNWYYITTSLGTDESGFMDLEKFWNNTQKKIAIKILIEQNSMKEMFWGVKYEFSI